jgi:hypothetical protein
MSDYNKIKFYKQINILFFGINKVEARNIILVLKYCKNNGLTKNYLKKLKFRIIDVIKYAYNKTRLLNFEESVK